MAMKNECKTVDEKPCIFPFMHRGKEVMNCISGIRRRKPWCPTKVDSNGIPIPGEWGNCNDQCPTEGSDLSMLIVDICQKYVNYSALHDPKK